MALATVLATALAVLWIGGVATYLSGSKPPRNLAWTAPAFLWISAAVPFVASPALRLGMAAAAAVGLMAEVVGLHTGWPFGEYRYGNVLGWKLAGVPLAVGAAWAVLTAYACSLWHARPAVLTAVLAAVYMVLLDMVLEPVAAGALGFWVWRDGGPYYGVPLRNFAGWLGVGLVATVFLLGRPASRAALWVGAAVTSFFSIIAWSRGLILPAIIGGCLMLVHAAVVWRRREKPR